MLSAIAAAVAATADDNRGPREQPDDSVRVRRVRRSRRPTVTADATRYCRRPTTIRPDQVAGHR